MAPENVQDALTADKQFTFLPPAAAAAAIDDILGKDPKAKIDKKALTIDTKKP